MRKKKLLLCVAVSSIFISCPVYAGTVEDVNNYLSELNGNGGHFQVYEFSPYDGLRYLHIVSTVDGEAGNGDTDNFIDQKNDLYRKLNSQEWYDWDYVFEDTFIKGKKDPSVSYLYDFEKDEAYSTLWGGYACTESISTGEVIAMSDYAETVEQEEDNSELDSDELTLGQQNALESARDYLSFTSFSHDGLINQLEFAGFTNEEAVYAADNCGADWNEQAAKAAQDYLEFTSFSRDGLINQLEFAGFTAEQAEYGASAVGY